MVWIAFFTEGVIVCGVMGGFYRSFPWEEGIGKNIMGKFVILGREGGAYLLT